MANERRIKPPGAEARRLLGILAFGMILVCLTVMVFRSNLDPDAKALITLIIGRLLGYVDMIYSFEFGSTRNGGSAAPSLPSPDAANKEVVR